MPLNEKVSLYIARVKDTPTKSGDYVVLLSDSPTLIVEIKGCKFKNSGQFICWATIDGSTRNEALSLQDEGFELVVSYTSGIMGDDGKPMFPKGWVH